MMRLSGRRNGTVDPSIRGTFLGVSEPNEDDRRSSRFLGFAGSLGESIGADGELRVPRDVDTRDMVEKLWFGVCVGRVDNHMKGSCCAMVMIKVSVHPEGLAPREAAKAWYSCHTI